MNNRRRKTEKVGKGIFLKKWLTKVEGYVIIIFVVTEKSPSLVYGARLELVYGLIAHRGFESLLLRQRSTVILIELRWIFYFSALRRLSGAKQRTTRYAGGRQKVIRKLTKLIQSGCSGLLQQKGELKCMANQTDSLRIPNGCKYHIVFHPKYRRKIICKGYRQGLKEIIQRLYGYKEVEIPEGHIMPDHGHLLLSIPPEMSVSSFMGCLKERLADV